MSFLTFFLRRFVTGAVARGATNQLTKRFRLSPGVANIAFVILTELLAQGVERGTQAATARKPKRA